MTNKLSNQKQMPELIKSIFREYDIRGIFPDELNEDSIAKIAKSIAHKCHKHPIHPISFASYRDALMRSKVAAVTLIFFFI